MKQGWMVVPIAVSAAAILLAKVTNDYDHSVDFAKFHTYSWVSIDVQDPLWKDRVTTAVDNELFAKGWKKVDNGPDATVVAVGATHIERTMEYWYGGIGGGWYHRGWGWGPPMVWIDRTQVGTLHVDIFDASTKKVIWHGAASDALSGDPVKNEKKLTQTVRDLFKKFPPPPKG